MNRRDVISAKVWYGLDVILIHLSKMVKVATNWWKDLKEREREWSWPIYEDLKLLWYKIHRTSFVMPSCWETRNAITWAGSFSTEPWARYSSVQIIEYVSLIYTNMAPFLFTYHTFHGSTLHFISLLAHHVYSKRSSLHHHGISTLWKVLRPKLIIVITPS